jgi:hypothetical protein
VSGLWPDQLPCSKRNAPASLIASATKRSFVSASDSSVTAAIRALSDNRLHTRRVAGHPGPHRSDTAFRHRLRLYAFGYGRIRHDCAGGAHTGNRAVRNIGASTGISIMSYLLVRKFGHYAGRARGALYTVSSGSARSAHQLSPLLADARCLPKQPLRRRKPSRSSTILS